MNLGEKINELRKKHRLTQEMLADRLAVSPQAVSKWERGVTNPDLYLIPKLAELFGITSDELLGLSVEKSPQGDRERALEQRISHLEKLVEILLTGDEKEALTISLCDATPVMRFDFTTMSAEDKQKWRVINGEILDASKQLIFRATPVARPHGNRRWDPQLVNESLRIQIDDVSLIRVRLKTLAGEQKAKLKLLFITEEHPHWHEGKRFSHHYETGKTVTVDFSTSHASWYGTLIGLRIDTTNQRASRCEIEAIELLDAQGAIKYQYAFTEKDGNGSTDWELRNSE
ncbi:MAG: helix-turn-helix transcriptional regulator, partial [Clostridia bacterium]|nr:helix-turn-helix transcriptional regulator [Clostridia bacterium]